MGLPPAERVPRRRKGIRVKVGDWFAVPLDGGGYCAGRAMVVDDTNEEMIAYFFGPRSDRVRDIAEMEAFDVQDAAYAHWVSMFGLTRFDWPLLGQVPGFAESEWPMPIFWELDFLSLQVRLEIPPRGGPVDNRSYLLVPCDLDDAEGRPMAGLLSHWGAQQVLSELLPLLPASEPGMP